MRALILNLARCSERREHMERELSKFGIEPFWIECADSEDFHGEFPADYDLEFSRQCIKRPMGKGEIACLLSHLRAYQVLLHSKDEWALILEDDVELMRNPLEDLSGFQGRLVLGVETASHNEFRRKIANRDGRVLKLSEAPYGAYCYAIHRVFAGEAIAALRQNLAMPIDVFFRHASRKRDGFWQVEGVAKEAALGATSAVGDEARMAGRDPSSWRRTHVANLCPKLIHQIWLGPNPVPAGVDSWRRVNPGRMHQLWREDSLASILDDYGVLEIFRGYLRDGYYPAAADIARYCVLHRFGGFYADADSVALRWLDIATPFVCWESETHRPGLIMNGFLQMRANHPIMAEMIREVHALHHPVPLHRVWSDLGPGLLTKVAASHDIQRLPSGLFCPNHFEGPNPDPGSTPYSKHEWGSTHKPHRERTLA